MLLVLTGYCLYWPSRAMVTFAMTYLGYDSLKVFSYAIFVGLCYIYSAAELHLSESARHLRGNSTKLTCLEITGYRIKCSTVLWLLELHIRRGRQVQTQVHTVNSNSRTANCQCSLFSKKNPVIRIFCISGWLAVSINPDKWSCAVTDPMPLGRRGWGGGLEFRGAM